MGEFDENEAARLRNELLVRRQVKKEREREIAWQSDAAS